MQEDKQAIFKLGLRWGWMLGLAFKVELSQIKTDKGFGLAPKNSTPEDTTYILGLGIDTVF